MLAHLLIRGNGPTTRGGRIAAALFLTAIVAAFAGVCGYETWRAYLESRWPPAPCTILESGVDISRDGRHDDTPYVFRMKYAYSWNGGRQVGTSYQHEYTGHARAAQAYGLARTFAKGSRHQCRVNPDAPTESVLRSDWSIWIVGGLVISGALTVVLVPGYVIPQFRRTAPKPRPWQKTARANAVAAGVFLLIFLGVFAWLSGIPIANCWRARDWLAVPCRIVDSRVTAEEIHGEHPVTLYRADVLFAYRLGETEYRSNDHAFTDLATPYYAAGKRAIVREFPAGAASMCYVNPADPAQAVLSIAVGPTVLFGAVFLALAVAVLCYILSQRRRNLGIGGDDFPRLKRLGVLLASAGLAWAWITVADDVRADYRAGEAIWGGVVMACVLSAAMIGAGAMVARSWVSRRPS
jgi:hypothetical protein